MKEITLVGAAATFGHEQELVGVAIDSADLDFGGQVIASVDFVVHGEWSHLAVTKVAREVRVVHASSNCFFVAVATEYELTFFTFDNCRARVLTHRQNSACCNCGVLQKIECNETIVVAGFGIIKNVAQLLQVSWAQEVCNVAHGFLGDASNCLG